MIEDMRMRKLEPKTQTACIRGRFQLHMVDEGTSPITLKTTIVGLNFLFTVTLGRPEVMARMQSLRVPLKLPVVLSKDEVARLIGATPNLKHYGFHGFWRLRLGASALTDNLLTYYI